MIFLIVLKINFVILRRIGFYSKYMNTMNVSDYMTQKPVQIQENDTVGHALRLMDSDRFRHLPVVDKQGKIVGMVSDRDLRTFTGDASQDQLKADKMLMPLWKIMSRPVVEISQDEDLREAARRMLDSNVGVIAVVHSEKLLGVLSYTDVLRAFIDEQ